MQTMRRSGKSCNYRYDYTVQYHQQHFDECDSPHQTIWRNASSWNGWRSAFAHDYSGIFHLCHFWPYSGLRGWIAFEPIFAHHVAYKVFRYSLELTSTAALYHRSVRFCGSVLGCLRTIETDTQYGDHRNDQRVVMTHVVELFE